MTFLLLDLLRFLYGPARGDEAARALQRRLEAVCHAHPRLTKAPPPSGRTWPHR